MFIPTLSSLKIRRALALLLIGSLVPAHLGAAQELQSVLARGRSAHAWDRDGDPRLISGVGTAVGLEGSYELRAAADGRFADSWQSRLSHAAGYDGADAWEIGFGGMPAVVELEDREALLAAAWIQLGLWAREVGPFALELEPELDREDAVALSLRLRGGLLRGTLWIGRERGLPVAFERRSPLGDDRWSFSEWSVGPLPPWPARVELQDGAGGESTFSCANQELLTSEPEGWLKRPVEWPTDHRFHAGVAPELDVRRVQTGHVLVHPRLSGRDLGWFLLDSGAGGMCIDPRAAAELELPRFGTIPVVGVGGVIEASFRQGKQFRLGPFELDDPIYVEVDLAFVEPFFGVQVAGICGYDLFARAVVRLDLRSEEVSLHSPDSPGLDVEGWHELRLDRGLPVVTARFEGDREELFRLDTGSMGTVDFHSQAVERLGLLEGRRTRSSRAAGAGGMVNVQVGELEWFELAGHRFERPQVQFSQAEASVLSTDYTTGLIGGLFLEPFQVVFDYPHRRVAFVPRAGE